MIDMQKKYTTKDGLRVVWDAVGRRTINGLPCGVSSLSDIELAACNGIGLLMPLDTPSLPEMPLP